MSYTKDFLESKSQQYPEILKMTAEDALRYLDFMGEGAFSDHPIVGCVVTFWCTYEPSPSD